VEEGRRIIRHGNRPFGGRYRFNLQGLRISRARNQRENFSCHVFSRCFLLGLFFDSEDRGDIFLRNVGWLSTAYTTLKPRSEYSSWPPLWGPQILQF
jgi:hypothetical protein